MEFGEASEGVGRRTLAAPTAEVLRLAEAANSEQLVLRFLGGVAVRLRCQSAQEGGLARDYHDIDCVVGKRQGKVVTRFLIAKGYEDDERFNALHGETRLIFHDRGNGRHVDVFLGTFSMCHTLDLEPRLKLPGVALSAADLLLTKLQIVELNRKDVQDSIALLLDHPLAEDSGATGSGLDMKRLVDVCARDWGWYTTFMENLEEVAGRASEFLSSDGASTIAERIHIIRDAIENAPKSVGWRMRAKLGRRLQWYELPEEVAR